jgi:hypothetical protein
MEQRRTIQYAEEGKGSGMIFGKQPWSLQKAAQNYGVALSGTAQIRPTAAAA